MSAYLSASPSAIRRPLLIALAAGLCIAALAAVVAITGGGFDDGVYEVISIALGFAIFSATAASGAVLLQRGWESVHVLGWATVGLSASSFVTLVVVDLAESHAQLLGVCVLATFAASHASIVTRDARDGDSGAILALCWTSIASAVVLAGIAITLVLGGLDDVGDGFWQAVAVLVVLWLLTFALAPILRRMQSAPAGASTAASATHDLAATAAVDSIEASLLAIADRLETLTRTYPIAELRSESQTLRTLARRLG